MSFTSVCLNVPLYLAWLQAQCRALGVVFDRRSVSHIRDAFALPARFPSAGDDGGSSAPSRASLVVNCTAMGSKTLGGVADAAMVPVRGQTVLVRNHAGGQDVMEASSTGELRGSDRMYVMERAAGGGTVLGGCYQLGATDAAPDPALTERILKAAVAACPALAGGRGPEALDVVDVRGGLRPLRQGGTRVERESLDLGDGQPRSVVHNYGHAGFGYQCSWGCSKEVVGLVEEALAEA